jgi:small Trp-rich protein
MWFIVIGVVLLVMKVADIWLVAVWPWWVVLAPFALAAIWWHYSDSTGLTTKREMDKLDAKKAGRRRKALEALGIDRETQKRNDLAERVRKAADARLSDERARAREGHDKVIRDSVFNSETGASSGFDESGAGGRTAKKKKK